MGDVLGVGEGARTHVAKEGGGGDGGLGLDDVEAALGACDGGVEKLQVRL